MRTLTTALTLSVLSTPLCSDTINVPADFPSIQDAINASVDDDVIVIAPGVYNESVINVPAKNITIQGSTFADGFLATTVNHVTGAGWVFRINGNDGAANPVIKDLRITGGNSPEGGGIWIRDSDATVIGCVISGNRAYDEFGGGGGGISVLSCSPTITECTFNENSAPQGGGFFATSGAPTLTRCTFTNNWSYYAGGAIAIGFGTDLTLNDCTISGNTAGRVGGALWESGSSTTCTLNSTTVCENLPTNLSGSFSLSEDSCEILSCVNCPSLAPSPSGNTPTTGACCLGGKCVTTTQSDCETAGGTYAGDDVACTDAECATSCPADTNRDGSVDGQDLAAVLANWGLPCEE